MTCSWDEEQERVMPVENLVQHFGAVADPRCGGKIEHRLTDILVIAVCAVIAWGLSQTLARPHEGLRRPNFTLCGPAEVRSRPTAAGSARILSRRLRG